MPQIQSKASSLGDMQPQVVSQRGNTRCTRGEYTLIQDLWNGDTEGLFPSQLVPRGGIRDVAEVTQSDLKVPDVVLITTFHGSHDFILCLFTLFIVYLLFFIMFLLILAPSITSHIM